jgi:hypothetical protein
LEQELAAAAVAAAERVRAEQEAAAATAAAVTYGEAAMRAANSDAEQLSAIAACTDILVLTAQLEEAAGREGLKYVRKAIRKQIKRLNAATTTDGAAQDSSASAEWLTALDLEQHLSLLVASGYYSVDTVQGASDAQLEQLGMPAEARLQFIEALKRTAAAETAAVDVVVLAQGDAVDDHYDVVDDGSDSNGFSIACWDVPPEIRLLCCKDSKLCNSCLDEVILLDQPCPLCREPINAANYCNIKCC